MPLHVAMHKPNSGIIGDESDRKPSGCRNICRITIHWVMKVEHTLGYVEHRCIREISSARAQDPKLVAMQMYRMAHLFT